MKTNAYNEINLTCEINTILTATKRHTKLTYIYLVNKDKKKALHKKTLKIFNTKFSNQEKRKEAHDMDNVIRTLINTL